MAASAGTWLRRLAIAFAALVALAVALVAGLWTWSLPDAPGPFYAAPASAASTPGALLRHEPFARALPPGARAHKLLYATTRHDGAPAVASALLVLPDPAPAGPMKLVAWTHGTIGVAPGCAPSLLDDPFQHIPAWPRLLAEGHAYVATDYVGLGTAGPHPYLIGEGEARSALDAIRAARQVPGVALDDRTVVWGHSQGGHAALWTGILAPAYAPDAQVIGVAAAAPASRLGELFEAGKDTIVGRIMSAYAMVAYASAYADVDFDRYVHWTERPLARDLARRCLFGKKALFGVAEAHLVRGSLFDEDPTSGPMGRRLEENVPRGRVEAPLLVAQGLADPLVLPRVQAEFVAARCAAGQALEYRTYAGRDHLTLVAPDSPFGDDLLRWTAERFAGAPAPSGCRTVGR